MTKAPAAAAERGWRNRIVGHGDVDPREVVQHPKNAKAHPKHQAQALEGVLEDLGWIATVTINRTTGTLIDGHLRVALAIKRGERTVPVTYVELTVEEEDEALLTRDPIGTQAKLEADKVDALLRSITTGNAAVQDLLATIAKDAGLYRDPSEGAEPEARVDDAEVLAAKWGTAPGQLWEVGPHRLLIGDATKPESYERLFLEGEQAACLYTDPPYGVSYQDPGGKFAAIANDALTGDDLARFLAATFRPLFRRCSAAAGMYVWHASSTRDDFAAALKAVGFEERQYLIWAKPSFALGHADYQWGHEPCFYGCKAGQSPAFHGGRDQSTVWRVALAVEAGLATTIGPGLLVSDGAGTSLFIAPKAPKGKKLRHARILDGKTLLLQGDSDTASIWEVARDSGAMHPTQKPAELARRAIENSTLPGQVVVDVFHGGGGTMVAAEQAGRICRAMELTPGYAAVELERMSEMDLKPRLLESA